MFATCPRHGPCAHAITNRCSIELTYHGISAGTEAFLFSSSCLDKPSVVHFHSIWTSDTGLQRSQSVPQ